MHGNLCVDIYEHLTLKKPLFPWNRDVAGGHMGMSSHVPHSGLQIPFLSCESRASISFWHLGSVVAQL